MLRPGANLRVWVCFCFVVAEEAKLFQCQLPNDRALPAGQHVGGIERCAATLELPSSAAVKWKPVDETNRRGS